jgi:hypothetical protein
LLLEGVDLVGGEDAFAQKTHLHLGERIAHGVGFALGCGAVQLVVVRERVGVGADAVAVDEGGPATGAAMGRSSLKRAEANFGVGAVDFGEVEVGEVGD